jgi:hypothetical protein
VPAARRTHPESSDEGKQAKADAEAAAKDLTAPADEAIAKETEQGFRGIEVDVTPNENYTVGGVVEGKPTPETDADAAAKAKAHTDELRREGDGPGVL